ncbi:uncharacterized protein [Amphiura filiformis]|uniref:uncharacterized protein n=1 Tax=Amphiura filiformis TaxID=82378 RepID=UPI003B214FC2
MTAQNFTTLPRTIEELQSDHVTTESRICQIHGEQVWFYCETEDKQVCMGCVSLKTCQTDHNRVNIKVAANMQADLIDGLMKKCADNKKRFQNAIEDTDRVLGTLNKSVKCTTVEAINCKEQNIYQVAQLFDTEVDKDKVKEIEDTKKVLKSEVDKIKEAEKQTSNLIASNSEFLITSMYSSMSKKLNELSLTTPVTVAKSLGDLTFESNPMMALPTGYFLSKKNWRLTSKFSIKESKEAHAIALNHDGDIAVTSYDKGVKVYARDGQVKCSFMDDFGKITGMTVSHDNKYIVASRDNYNGIQFHTSDGKYLSCVPVTDTTGDTSNPNTVTIDAEDRIIVGLLNNTVSIHSADGSFISKFATRNNPTRLAVTSEGELVCSYYYNPFGLELMDYCGSKVRVMQPPPDVKQWVPGYVCCGRGEIFVVNRAVDYPAGIYRYTSKGHYLGCVTAEVNNPAGITLSQDGKELLVVEYSDCHVKIFHRE